MKISLDDLHGCLVFKVYPRTYQKILNYTGFNTFIKHLY